VRLRVRGSNCTARPAETRSELGAISPRVQSMIGDLAGAAVNDPEGIALKKARR
jgi:hypothetical protein